MGASVASRRHELGYPIHREPAGPRPPDAARHLPHDVPLAAPGRQGDPAQAAEQDLLPDQRGRARGRAGGGGDGPAPRPRLVLRLLPRPRPHAPARHDADGDAHERGGGEGRPELRRPADAVALGPRAAERGHQVLPHRHAVPPGRGLRGGGPADRQARRGRLLLHRRGHHLGGRVLGEPEQRLQPEAARPLPRRGQRLRDLGPGRGPDRGRQHLAAGALASPTCSCARWTAAIPWPAWPSCARPRPGAAPGAAPRSCTRGSSGPYSHSLSDDETLYRPPAEREADARRDPVDRVPRPPDRAGPGHRGGDQGACGRRWTARWTPPPRPPWPPPVPGAAERHPARLLARGGPDLRRLPHRAPPVGRPQDRWWTS